MTNHNKETIRLLIVDALAEEAEAVLNVFRDAGHSTRAHHIVSMDSLDKALSGRQKWDLLLISEQDMPEGITINSVIERIEQQGHDVPVVVLSDRLEDDEILALIKQGVRCVIPQQGDELLLITAKREIADLNTRRNYRRMSVALNESEKQRRNLLNDQVDAIVYVGEGAIRYANPAFNVLLGRDENEPLKGTAFKELVASSDQNDVDEFLASIEDSGQALAAIQCSLRSEEGDVPVRAMVTPTSFEGHFTLSLLVRLQEVQQNSMADTEEARVSKPDSDTRLYDKKQFQEHLDVAIQRVISGKEKFALVCVSLDTLKAVHAKGGKRVSRPLLMEVAKRLGLSLIEHKASSWGGGQFMVLVKAADKDTVQTIADQLLEEVAETPVTVGKNKLPVKLSLGSIQLTDANSDAKTLLVRARHACAEARRLGGGKLCFYQKRKIDVVSSVEKHLAGMVSQAMQHDDLKLFYQPVISLKGSEYGHYEVMLRMMDARGREHDAVNFRSKLDKNSLWGKVDRWQVIQAGKDLMSNDIDKTKTRMFVHLGGNVIGDKEFLPWMGVALKAAGIKPQALVVELSEQNVVRFSKQMPDFFKAVRAMGCGTSVSEFGCSLNPVETIAALNLDFVKVDASFTKELTNESKGEELKAMVKQLSDSGRQIIVPNVESAVEMAPLWHSGVDFIQGDFLQGPVETMNYNFDE
ncbi:EAL domain-containing protein [Endozoicomonas gorgoniicola]|uniref:EAL domain-containing protein n=1 Tax=Endozoicomonas gorgoniicola TaxID=1234144 RepID=A0ABT3MWR7_9GAMM|nr:EAL domain-containing protein [Endozoicomonas gorgoniicola]MCW7553827.1 EAL domain-containing protein [Endozoicomonas gorgoniicola]